MICEHQQWKFTECICLGWGLLENGKINLETELPICVKAYSCSRCSYDVIHGCSHGGLSPNRPNRTAPRPEPNIQLLCNNIMWPTNELWTPSVDYRLYWLRNWEAGGVQRQMWVHIEGNSIILDMHSIRFPLPGIVSKVWSITWGLQQNICLFLSFLQNRIISAFFFH